MSHDDERQCWLDAVKHVTPLGKTDAPQVSTHAREENLIIPHQKKRRASPSQKNRAVRQRRLKFDRIIDLHGCSLSEAQHKVKQTIIHRHNCERWFLFITGQGKKAGAEDGFRGQGVLLNHFPQWMKASSVRSHIIDFGAYGAGAYYVHVRR